LSATEDAVGQQLLLGLVKQRMSGPTRDRLPNSLWGTPGWGVVSLVGSETQLQTVVRAVGGPAPRSLIDRALYKEEVVIGRLW